MSEETTKVTEEAEETAFLLQEPAIEETQKVFTLTDYQKEMESLEIEKAEVIKPFYENYQNTMEKLIELGGVGHTWQDENGVVYKLSECHGKFVRFEPYQIQRTRFEGEAKGSLSMTEAREKGFIVEGK